MSDTRLRAEALARALLERDDIGSLPIPASAKRYARMKSGILFKSGGQAKPQLYIDQTADTTNQADKKQGFKNYDGSAYTSPKARKKQPKLEGGTADFLRKHGIGTTRTIRVERDPNHESYLAIPVYDHYGSGRWTNLFKLDPEEGNLKTLFKDRLVHLVRHRRGYRPGDVFVSPLGRFLVTDVMGIKEV